MNALTPTKSFRVVERLPSNLEAAVVLERDIRVKPERIADYCLTTHEPIYEDLATLVESMACFDRLVPRRRSGGWTRKLTIQLPVYEHRKLQSSTAVEALTEAAWFLTGDQWSFEFVARQGAAPTRQGHLDLARAPIRHVIPFSDGLDSFAQARLSVGEHGRDAVMLVRSGLGHDRVLPGLLSLRVPRKFKGARLREVTYRTRPLVFYTLAAIAAVITGAEAWSSAKTAKGQLARPACRFPMNGGFGARIRGSSLAGHAFLQSCLSSRCVSSSPNRGTQRARFFPVYWREGFSPDGTRPVHVRLVLLSDMDIVGAAPAEGACCERFQLIPPTSPREMGARLSTSSRATTPVTMGLGRRSR